MSERIHLWLSPLFEAITVAGKEWRELRRQPGVLLLVVLGPFLVLAAFGIGYRNEELALRTIFVGDEDASVEDVIERNAESIDQYIVPVAYTSDLLAATRDLRAGHADVVIALPPHTDEAMARGEASEIAVLHDSIDPIEAVGIQFATEVAVRELNATVVASTLDALLDEAESVEDSLGSISTILDELRAAAERDDDDGTRSAALAFGDRLDRLDSVSGVLDTYGTSESSVEDLRRIADRVADDPTTLDAETIDELRVGTAVLEQQVEWVLELDADVLARPFFADAESLVREPVAAEDHVAPGATALLLQHLGISLAALSLVRDERRGLLDTFRIGPTSVASVLAGKLGSLTLVTFAAGMAVIAGQVFLLGVPQRGSWIEIVVVVAALSFAAVAVGLLIATVSASELQASQAAMIALLLALFFSGFLLDLDRIREPLRSLGQLVPATPATEALRNVQLRSESVASDLVLLLAIQAAIGSAIAAGVMRHRWKSGR